MVSVLVNIFGSHNLQLAEDVVQDALLSALDTWKFKGVPDNPRAWLYKVARNQAIDIIRKGKHQLSFDFSDPKRKLLTSEYTLASTLDKYWQEEQVNDDFLGMMFACCHPSISEQNQMTFILKSLCGFSTREVARAFLTDQDTISKRLYRTKEFFRNSGIKPEIPPKSQLAAGTGAVLQTIYLLFNEGYNSTESDSLIRNDLISQALYLGRSLAENQKTRLPETNALMALMCLHASRSPARITEDGNIIPLAKQDRTRWDRQMIMAGNEYLNRSAVGNSVSAYHLEAAIAYEHCVAPDYQSTNWESIGKHYDSLLTLTNDPVVALNRCIVIMELQGAEKALASIRDLQHHKSIGNYYLYHAILGEIYQRLGDSNEAISAYQRATQLTLSGSEKRYLVDKISTIQH